MAHRAGLRYKTVIHCIMYLIQELSTKHDFYVGEQRR